MLDTHEVTGSNPVPPISREDKMKRLIILLLIIPFYIFGQDYSIPLHDRDDPVYSYEGFKLCYSEEHEQALWVAYELTREESEGDIGRTNDFRPDPRIETETASLDDYRGSGYDRGHMAPAGDMSWSESAMSESFYMSNMSPQKPYFNRVTWRMLESIVREWSVKYDKVYIVTGPILADGPYLSIGKNKVSVPNYYYKVILRYSDDIKESIAFMMPNKKTDKPIKDFVVSVNFIEALTGIDFFYLLDNDIEEIIESNSDFNLWY